MARRYTRKAFADEIDEVHPEGFEAHGKHYKNARSWLRDDPIAFREDYLAREDSLSSEVEEARFGYDGVVRQPTLFLAGESGREHVRIRPLKGRGKPRRSNIFDWRNFI